MVSVVDLKNRAIERLEGFSDNPRALPALVHARYNSPVPLPTHKPIRQKFSHFALRKHKPHQMHAQHRSSCVLVLQWLVKRMDITTRQCVFVNPKHNIRRTIYIPELARHTGLCERTITRVMDTITRARYVLRTVVGKTNQRYHYYLSDQLFRDLKLDISLRVLSGRLKGLAKKKDIDDGKRPSSSAKGHASKSKPDAGAQAPAWKEADKPYANLSKPDETQRSVGNAFLDKIRRRRPSPSG